MFKMSEPSYRENIKIYFERILRPETLWDESVVEIVEVWSDLYLLGFDPNLYTAESNDRANREFTACFSEEELKAMRDFHQYFSSANDIDISWTYEQLKEEPAGKRLFVEVKRALQAFGVHPD